MLEAQSLPQDNPGLFSYRGEEGEIAQQPQSPGSNVASQINIPEYTVRLYS